MSVDPHWFNVALALPMEGVNGSTTFTDYSPSPESITRYGNTVISTAQSKWGNGSGYFDGSGDYLTSSGDFKLLSGDFTIEFWFYGAAQTHRVLSCRSSTVGWLFVITPGTNCGFAFWPVYLDYNQVLGLSPPANQWNHIAACRSGDIYIVYVNGVGGTPLVTVKRPGTHGVALNIGRDVQAPTTGQTQGYLQDLRITEGVARYIADFTPPAEPMFINRSSISGTVYEKNASGVYVPGAYPVRLYKRSDGSLVASTTSAADGSYNIAGLPITDELGDPIEYYVVALDTEATWQTPGLAEQVFPS